RAEGDYVVVMDCDLQDQPEEIRKMYDHLRAGGFEAVFGSRVRRRDGWFKRARSLAFRRVISLLAETPLAVARGDTSNFSIIARRVALAYRLFQEKERLYGVIVSRILPKIGVVAVEHAPRPSGRSAYNLRKNIRLAANAVIANSHQPLVFSIYCALSLFILAFALGAKVLLAYFLYGSPVLGWTSTMVLICFFFGLQMLFMGILGAYISQIALESKRRPFYLVARTLNLEDRSKTPESARPAGL
ncbi:MAG: glycosyltransferase, partial [Candidatus Adiutrix sp.]|nr:glycosyltransferase [Candidatus Adiutrix sp.]